MDSEQGIRVVLVDDHRSVLWGLERLIDGERPRMRVVATATCPAEALEAVSKHRPHVVLLDLDLDGKISLGLISQMRERCDAKAIIVTGLADSEMRERAIIEGARGLVLKSEPAATILTAIDHVHNGELWLDSGAAGNLLAFLSRRRGLETGNQPRRRRLTSRERFIVASMVKYKSVPNKTIANELHISGHTLRNHLVSIYAKLGVRRRLELVLYAMEHGLDQPLDP